MCLPLQEATVSQNIKRFYLWQTQTRVECCFTRISYSSADIIYVSITIVQSYTGTSLLLSELLRVCSTKNNVNGNKQVIFSQSSWYYGDNDFIIRTFDFIARPDAYTWLIAPDTNCCMTRSTDTDSHVTCSTKYGFYELCAAARLPHWLPYISMN